MQSMDAATEIWLSSKMSVGFTIGPKGILLTKRYVNS